MPLRKVRSNGRGPGSVERAAQSSPRTGQGVILDGIYQLDTLPDSHVDSLVSLAYKSDLNRVEHRLGGPELLRDSAIRPFSLLSAGSGVYAMTRVGVSLRSCRDLAQFEAALVLWYSHRGRVRSMFEMAAVIDTVCQRCKERGRENGD